MKTIRFMVMILFSFAPCLLLFNVAVAGDLDDGISKYTDGSISKMDNLGKPSKNTSYIIMRAKSQAAMGEKQGNGTVTGSTSGGNMNSVVVGAGTNIKGDIIIIDQSKGNKTQVVE